MSKIEFQVGKIKFIENNKGTIFFKNNKTFFSNIKLDEKIHKDLKKCSIFVTLINSAPELYYRLEKGIQEILNNSKQIL